MSDVELEDAVRSQLGGWFGADEVAAWKLIKVYRIPFAQPDQVMHHSSFAPLSPSFSLIATAASLSPAAASLSPSTASLLATTDWY